VTAAALFAGVGLAHRPDMMVAALFGNAAIFFVTRVRIACEILPDAIKFA